MREIGDSEHGPAAEIDLRPNAQQHPSWLGEPTPGYQAPGEQGEIGAEHPEPAPPTKAAGGDEDWLADAPYAEAVAWSGDHHDAPVAVDAAIAVAMANAAAYGYDAAADPESSAIGRAVVRPAAMPEDPDHDQFRVPVQDVPRERWIPAELHGGGAPWTGPVPARPVRAQRSPRRLAVALPLMLVLGLLAAFFSWVSSEPLWLAVGHGTAGTATVTRCIGDGISQRCRGEFVARDAAFTAADITLMGGADTTAGQTLNARMVGANSHRAYAGGLGTMHLRWLIGLVLVLLCGLGIVLTSGALRLPDRGERLAAIGTSFGAPLLIAVGFLAATF